MSRQHTPVALDPADVRIEASGLVSLAEAGHAQLMVAALTRLAHEPVLHARVKLGASADPAVERPYTAQANLDVNGRLIRAQAAAPSTRQAIHLLRDRLRTRLSRTARDWEILRGRRPEDAEHEWRHASPPRRPLPYLPRPEGERRIIRHKSFALTRATTDEAAFDMEQLDYDVHLFTEQVTGQNSAIFRVDRGYSLAQVQPHLMERGR